MRVVVATHGHCFDGLSSAVVFSRLLRELEGRSMEFSYHSCGYGVSQQRPEHVLDEADASAILDYRFSATDRLTWYFDHHRTAFGSDADREFFEERRDNGRFFYDPDYSSCARMIGDIAREHFKVEPDLSELMSWADRVDTASFDSPEAAVDRSHPVMRLVNVVENLGDDALLTELVPQLLERPLMEVARSQLIEERYRPLGKKHEHFVECVRAKSQPLGRVVLVDLTDITLDTLGKFVTYALHPDCTYSVVVGKLPSGMKISVGYNKWSGKPLDTDISAICARYGGGGHPVVGGISFATSELERARQVARTIADELNG